MALDAGKLRHRVTIEKRIDVQDTTTGGITTNWTALFTNVPAAIEPLSARELLAAASVRPQVVAKITLRYRAGLNASQRIKHGSKIYNPEGVIADMDSGLEFVTIPCSQGVNDG